MDDEFGFAEAMLTRQKTMFRLAAAQGFTQEVLFHETPLGRTSLSDYATGKTKLSLSACYHFAKIPHFPASLLSLLFDGTGRHIADDEPAEPDYDALGLAANGLAGEVQRARSPASPGGTNIVPSEKEAIRGLAHLAGEGGMIARLRPYARQFLGFNIGWVAGCLFAGLAIGMAA